ncbi:hypothetical protein GPL15_15290 [Clostridium sp. MCC353]|nr:hypothetical protein [Clostridium sp. MCC353]
MAAALTAVVLIVHGNSVSTAAQSGWAMENGNWCYYDNSGNRVTDEWKESNGGWYYLGGDGYMLKNTLIEEDDDYYYVNSSGMMVKSQWKTILNEDREEDEPEYWWYYFRDNGKAWKNTGSNVSLKSIKKADGTIGRYIFDDEGRMQFGWVNENGEHVPEDDAYKEAVYYCGDNGDGSVASNTWARVILEDEVDENGDTLVQWLYLGSNGKKITGVFRTINGKKYGFNEEGEMLRGLYKLKTSGSRIEGAEKILEEDDLPENDDDWDVYYFSEDSHYGTVQTGNQTVRLDGEKYSFTFKSSGIGMNGISDGNVYKKGRKLEADSDLKYEPVEYDGKEYLVNTSGRIMKNKKNLKDGNDTYYCTDKSGVVTYHGEDKYSS